MSEQLDPLFAEAIQALSVTFSALSKDWVVIGGVAAGLVGVPRATKDVDAMTVFDTAEVDRLLDVAAEHGFHGRFVDTAEFARRLMWRF